MLKSILKKKSTIKSPQQLAAIEEEKKGESGEIEKDSGVEEVKKSKKNVLWDPNLKDKNNNHFFHADSDANS